MPAVAMALTGMALTRVGLPVPRLALRGGAACRCGTRRSATTALPSADRPPAAGCLTGLRRTCGYSKAGRCDCKSNATSLITTSSYLYTHTHTHTYIYIEFFCYYFNFNLHRIFFEMKMNRWINLYMGWIFVWLNFVWLERVQNLGLLWWKHFQGIGRRTCASGQREVKWKRRIEKKYININKNIKK